MYALEVKDFRRGGFAVVLAALSLILGGCGINNIPTYDEQVVANWSQVLNQYQRRTDLIPNLVNTVKGFAAQEEKVLIGVVEARSKVSQMQLPKDVLTNPAAFKSFQQSQDELGGALSRLMVVVEKYPELKSNQNFLSLQSQLEGTENRIAVARKDYIDGVQKYNTEIRTFPGIIWANTMHRDAKLKENFTISEAAKEVPKVQF